MFWGVVQEVIKNKIETRDIKDKKWVDGQHNWRKVIVIITK